MRGGPAASVSRSRNLIVTPVKTPWSDPRSALSTRYPSGSCGRAERPAIVSASLGVIRTTVSPPVPCTRHLPGKSSPRTGIEEAIDNNSGNATFVSR